MSLDKTTQSTLVEFYRWFGFKSEILRVNPANFGGVIPYLGKRLKIPCIVLKDERGKSIQHVNMVN